MADSDNRVEVIDLTKVSPPANSVPSASLPLTFLDIPWLTVGPMLRLFFYKFPSHHYDNNRDFFDLTIIPALKQTLSLTLQHYFPLAGHLIWPPQQSNIHPHILYVPGDSVPFIVAESSFDFNQLVADHPQDVKVKRQFVAELPEPFVSSEDGTRSIPLMAIQVTHFPQCGFSIGLTLHHAVTDGKGVHSFVKNWANICKNSNGDLACLQDSLPIHDREFIKDPIGVLSYFLDQYRILQATRTKEVAQSVLNDAMSTKVRATCTISRAKIESLKKMVSAELDKNNELESSRGRTSSFTLTGALIWVCLTKSNEFEDTKEDVFHHFTYVADCRGRFEFPVPQGYFGNCLLGCHASLKRSKLLGETAIVDAARAIAESIVEMENNTLTNARKWWGVVSTRGSVPGLQTVVVSSPKFEVYKTDFGWGKPTKSEVVMIDVMQQGISLSDSRNGDGGVEVGVALGRAQMNSFLSALDDSLKSL